MAWERDPRTTRMDAESGVDRNEKWKILRPAYIERLVYVNQADLVIVASERYQGGTVLESDSIHRFRL